MQHFTLLASTRVGAALMLLWIAACSSFTPDHEFNSIAALTSNRLERTPIWARDDASRRAAKSLIDELLSRPLLPEDAVQIALVSNRELQMMYASLGIAEADVVQAGRLPNPRFGTTRTRSDESFKYETSFTLPIVALLTMPSLLRIERQRFERVKLEVSDRVLKVAHDVRFAYFDVIAAEENLRYQLQIQTAAQASAELAQRMRVAGNFSKLDELRERAFSAEAEAGLAMYRSQVSAARERLNRLLGLDAERDQLTLPRRLPDLPLEIGQSMEGLEAFALDQRLDVAAAKQDAIATAASLGLTRATRFINVLELGPATLMERGETIKKGYDLSVELPLFDWGSAKVVRAQARYEQSMHHVAHVALSARSEVREAMEHYRRSWEAARVYRDQLVPLRKQISDEYALRYNGMLMSVFELLADAKDQINAVTRYIDAARAFWQADAQLRMSLGGALPTAWRSNSTTPAPKENEPGAPAPGPEPEHDHSQHHKG